MKPARQEWGNERMRIKVICLGLVLLLALSTIVMQISLLGNYEELSETEYEEYQISIDYGKMMDSILSLFDWDSGPKITPRKQAGTEAGSSGGAEQGPSALQTAPTAPTIPTINMHGGE